MTSVELKKQINKLPQKPGIYLFKNAKNKPLYIGKALNLKNRVSHYLKASDSRLVRMLEESRKIDFIQTDSDIEALILESQYIKKCRPDFNIMLRDDKQYGFVGFTNEQFPKIFITHQPTKSATADFVGPFTEIGALKTTLRLLRKVFPYCTCKQLHNNYCLNYHIGKCQGYCCLKKPATENLQLTTYDENIKAIRDILSSKRASLIKQFEKEMIKLGKNEKYEEAMELQYKVRKLKRIFENARIIYTRENPEKNTDILKQLAKIIGIRHAPDRIEAYDIANIQGQYAVGAMVVFTGGKTDNNQYRKFKILNNELRIMNYESRGDTGMLKEVLIRRFNHPEWPRPDLIIVDGGKQQLNAVGAVVNHKSQIPIIALTKNERHTVEKIILENGEEIKLSKLPTEIKNFLIRIDSEAHRFAITYYRNIHRKNLK